MKRNFISLIVFISFTFISCSNFQQTGNLKDEIDKQIKYYLNSASSVYISADPGTGTVLPGGSLSMRSSDSVDLEFTPSENAVFKRWQAIDKNTKKELNGVVEFSDQYALKCKATLISSVQEVLIKPYCFLKQENEAPVFVQLEVSRGDDKTQSLSQVNYETGIWTEDDYNKNHVNAINVSFTGVDKGSGIYSIKITETLVKDVSGNTPAAPVTNYSEITKDITYTGNEGEYTASFKHELLTTNDGLFKLEFQLWDNSGNYSDSKTYYIIKDTKIPFVFVGNNGVTDGKTTFVLYFEEYSGNKYNPYKRTFADSALAEPYLVEEYIPTSNKYDTWFETHKTSFEELEISYKFHDSVYTVPSNAFSELQTITDPSKVTYKFKDCRIEINGIDSSKDESFEFYVKDKAGNIFTNYVTVPKREQIYSHTVAAADGKLSLLYRREAKTHALIKKSSEQNYRQYSVSNDGLKLIYNTSVSCKYDGTALDAKLVSYSTSGANGYHNMVFGEASEVYQINSNGAQTDNSLDFPAYTATLTSKGLNSDSFNVRITFTNEDEVKNFDSIYAASSTSSTKVTPLENGKYIDISLISKAINNGVTYVVTVVKGSKKKEDSFTVNTSTQGFTDNSAPRLNYLHTDNASNYNIGQYLNATVASNLGGSSMFDDNDECRMYYYIRPAKSNWTAAFLFENGVPDDVYENIDKKYLLSNETRAEIEARAPNMQWPSFTLPIAAISDGDYAIYVKLSDMAGNTCVDPIAYFSKLYAKGPKVSVVSSKVKVESDSSFNVVTYCYFDKTSGTWKDGEKITGYSSQISKTFSNTVGNYFIKVRTLHSTGGVNQTELQDYDNRIYRISSPTYYYTGLGSGTCKKKVLLKGIGGFVVYCDNPVYIHTVYDSKDWGDDAEKWERFVLDSQKVNPIQIDSSDAYTIDETQIPVNSHYRVIAHFADGTSLISEDMVKLK